VTLSHLTRLFREPEFLLARYSHSLIDQGLSFIVSASQSSHMDVMLLSQLPWENRKACFDAMVSLYSKLMAPVYGNELGHLQSGSEARENFACYMWWDVIGIYGGMEHGDRDRINAPVLGVFERVLKLTSEACLESILHGLGHWHLYIPDQTEPIVHRFLARTDISPELREYAERAAVGAVQ
jgi:hypothetical protein